MHLIMHIKVSTIPLNIWRYMDSDSLTNSNYVKVPHDVNLDTNQILLIFNIKYDILEQLYYMYS